MQIGLIDVDSHNFPNLALMKISAWHKAQGNNVEWWWGFGNYNKVYMSKVFDDTYSPDIPEPLNAKAIIKGGTGYGLNNKLPDDIEHMYPDYSLYPTLTKNTAYGFLTRGCPRACGFCLVSEKEGRRSKKVADLSEFWSGQKHIKLLDPNLLAAKEHAELLGQLADSGAWVDFTQGLDIRLVTSNNIDVLNRIKTKMLHFAWDNPQDNLEPLFAEFAATTTVQDFRKRRVYILTNFNSTHAEDLYRVEMLKDIGFDPYVMIYNKPSAPRKTRMLARWCNNKRIFRSIDKFGEYNPRLG